MADAKRPSTYQRIIDASLQLFNEHGERTISTNHIAQHLSMSPGNLYYHFANKDEIIMQLFKRYSETMHRYLMQTKLPESVSKTVGYAFGLYDILWHYRFLFSDVNTLLVRSAALLGEHHDFTRIRIAPLLVKLLQQLADNGVIVIDEIGVRDLSVNMWLITKYWFEFDHSLPERATSEQQAKARGVYRTLSLLRPYIDPTHLPEFDQMVKGMDT
ncbi:MAG: TetR/AcrR family transcriptional regulator [Alysiella sp.]|uniref:TetR/AcrR family transcriptional regulator n=1 Tax=Alysiella sp. TaxID=1872483 RepID=UPI0026DC4B90|nr:TetR/AcrR family transcriptional regulator [Alysiella sp.]MDO4432971.1 TetR/AcrR family transcriptional regulator [Alysiella sp.]